MSDISPYLIITALSVILLAITLIAAYLFYKNKHQSQLKSGGQRIVSQKPVSACYHNAYKFLPEVIITLNSQSKITYLNIAAENMLGHRLRSVMGKDYRNILSLTNSKTHRKLLEISSVVKLTKKEVGIEGEYFLNVNDKKNIPIKLNIMPLMLNSSEGGEANYLLVLRNIAEIKGLQSKVSMLDSYDSLTGVLNRKAFDNEIKQLMESTHKHNSVHVLSYFSIDQFSDIRDTIGHSGTESLNKKIIEIIKPKTRENVDIVARVADSEFCIVFRDSKLASCINMIKAILKDTSEHQFKSAGQQYPVSMSAGFVIIDKESTSSSRLISEANRACNTAAKRGGNILPYLKDDKDMQSIKGNIEWILILKKAIQENRFEMYAQPIHPLTPVEYQKPFSHYELLIRLNDEQGNPISTVEFISAAEYYHMMPALDRWVIRDTLRQIGKVPEQTPLPVFAINLSGQSLNDPTFLDYILGELKASSVNPQMLCFEITEQVAVSDMTLLNKLITRLKSMGCSFSLDDFGTGASTFEYLKSLNVDYLKIDGSFVKNIATDKISRSMAESATQIGHTMNLKIIAEYVENEEILNILNDIGIEYGQGYHIARPGPLSAVIKRHQNVKQTINL